LLSVRVEAAAPGPRMRTRNLFEFIERGVGVDHVGEKRRKIGFDDASGERLTYRDAM